MTTSMLSRLGLRALAVLQVAAVVLLVGLGAVLLAGVVPGLLGDESFVVSAEDMQPALQVGDLAIVHPIGAAAVAVGDVVVYRTPQDPDTAITRRILSVDPDAKVGLLNLQTRGDADPTAEQINVASGAVLGRVVFSIPRLGLVVQFANQPIGKLLLIGLPGLLLAGDWLRSRVRRRRPTPSLTTGTTARIQSLLDSGQRALSAGFPLLAARAAEGVLALDAHNQAAGLLKALAIQALEVDREHVAA